MEVRTFTSSSLLGWWPRSIGHTPENTRESEAVPTHPSGQNLQVSVACRQERIEAFAVSERCVMDEVVRYRKLARLNLAQVTHLDITAADRAR